MFNKPTTLNTVLWCVYVEQRCKKTACESYDGQLQLFKKYNGGIFAINVNKFKKKFRVLNSLLQNIVLVKVFHQLHVHLYGTLNGKSLKL